MNHTKILEEITSELQSNTTLSADKVLEWMKSDDIQVHAAIVMLISEHENRINPPLEGKKVFDFCLSYYKRCFLENPPDGEFTGNRTVEGYTFQKWFKELWTNRTSNLELIEEMKRMITETYKVGDDGVKYVLETAVLEHLFEEPEIADYFSDWQNDNILSLGYERAREWKDSMK
jgi:hypothetical protein